MTSLFSRNTLLVVAVGIALLIGLWYMFSGDKPKGALLTTTSVSGTESIAEIGIVETLLTLRDVSLSGTIFSDPAFGALRDFGTQIIPEPVGRPNPFAPRGVGDSSTTDKNTLLPDSTP